MPVTSDKYDQLKIDKLKHFLEEMAAKGQARPYEIFVDSLKVVPKTEDPKEFDTYEYYMNEDSEKVRILIYNSLATPRNDQYCFYVQRNKTEKPLNGLGDLDGIIQEKLAARDREYELARLQTELESTKQQLEEAEEYAEELEKQLEESKSNKHKLGNLDLVELGSVLLQRVAAKNPAALAKMGLSGLVDGSAVPEIQPTEQTAASFQRKPDSTEPTDEQLQYLPLLQQLYVAFEKPQLEKVLAIIARLAEEPAQVDIVSELLNV